MHYKQLFRLDFPLESPQTNPFQTPSKWGHPNYPSLTQFLATSNSASIASPWSFIIRITMCSTCNQDAMSHHAMQTSKFVKAILLLRKSKDNQATASTFLGATRAQEVHKANCHTPP